MKMEVAADNERRNAATPHSRTAAQPTAFSNNNNNDLT